MIVRKRFEQEGQRNLRQISHLTVMRGVPAKVLDSFVEKYEKFILSQEG
jgi:hypothetical protein